MNGLSADLRGEAVEVMNGYEAAPSDPCVLYEIASIYARAGEKERALQFLKAMQATGAGLDPRPRDFGSVAETAAFKDIVARVRQANHPVLRARHAFTITGDVAGLAPEGIARSRRTGNFYMGGTRKIFVVDATGNASVFVASTAGLASVLGLRVDDARGELWAVSNHLGNPVPGTQSGLFRFRISDGAPIGRYPLEDDGKHGLNDVVVAPDGDVYATATNGSTVVELDPSIGKFRDFLPEGAVPDANGITISPDGRFLFVAGWYSITRIEWRTRQVQVLKKPDNIADGCNDGLYYYGRRSLVGIQNCVHVTGRVMRYDLSPDLSTITKATVLESYNPVFDGITTGAIAGQEFFFIGNTQLRKLSPTAQTRTSVDPFVMLRVQMGAR